MKRTQRSSSPATARVSQARPGSNKRRSVRHATYNLRVASCVRSSCWFEVMRISAASRTLGAGWAEGGGVGGGRWEATRGTQPGQDGERRQDERGAREPPLRSSWAVGRRSGSGRGSGSIEGENRWLFVGTGGVVLSGAMEGGLSTRSASQSEEGGGQWWCCRRGWPSLLRSRDYSGDKATEAARWSFSVAASGAGVAGLQWPRGPGVVGPWSSPSFATLHPRFQVGGCGCAWLWGSGGCGGRGATSHRNRNKGFSFSSRCWCLIA